MIAKHQIGRRCRYPSRAMIRKIIEAARECEIQVTGLEVTPDGRIRVYDRAAPDSLAKQNDFDRWEDKL